MTTIISGDVNLFREGFNICGIYAISGLAPCSFETPIYIGSSENIQYRIERQHLPKLERGKHVNLPLQNYYNAYGVENIVVLCLEVCEPEKLLEVEQKYIDYYGVANNKKSFNVAKFANATMKDRRPSQQSIEKMRQIHTGKLHSKEAKDKIRKSQSGNGNSMWNKPKPQNSGNPPKEFTLISPQNEIFKGANIREFCRIHSLQQTLICRVLKGKQHHHKGWTKSTEKVV